MKNLLATLAIMALWIGYKAESAVLTSDNFDTTAEGWTGAGNMTVTHNDTEGTPLQDGSLQGSFASQGFFFIPQTGSFRIDTGTDFLGTYPGGANLTGFTFDFMADSVLPLDVNLRLLSGLDAYYYTLDISSLGTGAWTPYTVFLGASGWQGNAGVLANVTAIEVQVARGSSAAQLFFLDNFGTTADPYVDPGGSAVPEPSTGLMVIYLGALLYGTRKRLSSPSRAGYRLPIGQTKRTVVGCALLGLTTLGATAAGIQSEGFADGQSVSEASLSLGAGGWTFTGGVAQVTFAATTPYAIPDVATLRPSSGAFTGNYVEAGLAVIGFRFRSQGQAPSSLYVELDAGGAVYQRVLPVSPSSEWQSYMVSLASLEEGGWTVKKSSRSDFAAGLADVQSIALKIRRSGASATDYAIDDLFVDGLPQAAGGVSAGATDLSMAWNYLQLGSPYTMQESPSLNGPWKDAQTVTATSRLQQFSIPANGSAAQAFFRLRGP